MSLSVDGVWKAGVWAPTVWADGVWHEGAAPAQAAAPFRMEYGPLVKRKEKEPRRVVRTDEENSIAMILIEELRQ